MLLAASACAPYLPRYPASDAASETGFYENVGTPRLALLEYRLGKYFAQRERPYPVVCAAAEGFSPSDPASFPKPLGEDIEIALMKRFPQLSPLSRCERDGLAIVAADTGQPGAIFDVNEFSCESATKCLGWGGYYAQGQHGWSYYSLSFERGEWRIRPEDLGIVLTAGERGR